MKLIILFDRNTAVKVLHPLSLRGLLNNADFTPQGSSTEVDAFAQTNVMLRWLLPT